MRFCLFIILTAILLPACFATGDKPIEIQRSANFFSDFVDYFNVPPYYVIHNGTAYDNSMSYQLFIRYITGNVTGNIRPIYPSTTGFMTTGECRLMTEDIIEATKKLQEYLDKEHKLPVAIKIDSCYISNSDFMYLLSSMVRSEFEYKKYNESYSLEKKYFSDTIRWNENTTRRYIEFTMDYESDRPVYSESYTPGKSIVDSGAISTGINPRITQRLCTGSYCTRPDDYETSNYTSFQVAWHTAIKENGSIIFPGCYPYCGVIKGTPIILDNFIYRYGFPMTWHMTGDSVVAILSEPALKEKILRFKNNSLLDLGLHTMYHTNMGNVTLEFANRSINENYASFRDLLTDEPTEFRTPYLLPPEKSLHWLLKTNGIHMDNDLEDEYCSSHACNYLFLPEYNLYYVKVDSKIQPGDELLNIYITHPWEVIYEATGYPIYLSETGDSGKGLFSKWMHIVGTKGLVPTTAKDFVEGV